jgi:hypothetical protein
MPSSESRSRLAAAQAALVRSLVGQAEPPPGFASERVRLASRSLVNKRVREVARAWPALVQALGDRFHERFHEFAQRTPPPAEGGPLADGRSFLGTLSAAEQTDELRTAALWVDLGQCRWAGLRFTWLAQSRQLLIGVRLPWLGMHGFTIPLRRLSGSR